MRLAYFDYPFWAVGHLCNEIMKRVSDCGVVLDWNVAHDPQYIRGLVDSGYVFLVSGPGLYPFLRRYNVPPEVVYLVSHDDDDFSALRHHFRHDNVSEALQALKGFAVPTDQMVCSVLSHGIKRIPDVVSYGINVDAWTFRPRREIRTVGVCGAFARQSNTGHADCKRGWLPQEVAQQAGVSFANTNGGVADVNAWFQTVDVNMVAGLFEGGPLSPLEAAACGIPTIGTASGQWVKLAHAKAGHLVSTNSKRYIAEALRWIRYYQDNPLAYEELSYQTRAEVLKCDWQYVIREWIAFFDSPSTGQI